MTDQGNGPRSTGVRARGPAAGQAGERASLSKAPAVSSSRAAAEIVAMKKKLAETTALAVKYKQSALKLKEAADQRARQLAISQKQAQALKQELQTQSSLAQQSSERVKSLESDLQDLRILVETQESVVTRQLLQIETTNFEVEQRAAQHEAQVTSLKQQLQLKVEDSQATLLGLHDQLTAKESLIENLERDLRQRQQECIQLQDDLATRPMPDEFAALEQALDELASVSDEKDAILQNQGQQLAKIQEQLAASREESADLLKTHQTALAEIDGLRHYLSTELEQRQQELQLQMAQSEQNDELHRYQQSLQLQAIQWLEAELYRQTQLGNYYQTALAELQLLEKSQNSQIRQLEAENSWREQAISYLELHLQENQTAKTLLGQQLQQLGQRIAQLQAQVETAAVEHQSLRQELQQSQEQKLFLEQQLSADQAQQKLNEQQQQALVRQFQEQLDLGILEQERLQRSLYDSAEENHQHKSHLSTLHLQIQEQHQQLEFGQKEHQNLTAALELVGQQLQVSLEQTRRNAAQVQQLESTLSVREAEKAELNFLLDTLLEAIAQSEGDRLGSQTHHFAAE